MTLLELKAAGWGAVVLGAALDAYLIRTAVIAYRSGVTYGALVKGPIRRSENPNLYWRNVLMGVPAITMITGTTGWFVWAILRLPDSN